MQRTRLIALLICCTFALVTSLAVAQNGKAKGHQEHAGHDHSHADAHAHACPHGITGLAAVIMPTEGNEAHGIVTFTSGEDGKVTVRARVRGLTPNSKHGFHIHEFGDARSDDGSSAGGHYNPEGHDHALPNGEARHAGDLGNLEADEQGNAQLTLTVDNISLCCGKAPILGRGLVVHAKPDDGGQPTGNAGSRIGMGVIGIAQPSDK